jgi:hypothetical protein
MKAIDFAVTINGPAAAAQERILDSVDHRLRSVGYARREKTEALEYRPKFAVPAAVWAIRGPGALPAEDLLPDDVGVPAVLSEFAQHVEVHPAKREWPEPVAVDLVV